MYREWKICSDEGTGSNDDAAEVVVVVAGELSSWDACVKMLLDTGRRETKFFFKISVIVDCVSFWFDEIEKNALSLKNMS